MTIILTVLGCALTGNPQIPEARPPSSAVVQTNFRDPPLPPWWDPGDLPWDDDPADTEGSGA